jgi:uncharacterized protein (TIGR00730 family)
MTVLHTITVYSGSADGLHPLYYDAACHLGEYLAHQGIAIVFGGGRTGLMGALADGALAARGEVIGVINDSLNTPTLAHAALTHMETFPDLHSRKARMIELADAFIALPGGFGTFDELFETLTWAQLGLHTKPVGLLNVNGYFAPLLAMVEHAVQEGFIYPEHRALICTAATPEVLLRMMECYQPPEGLQRWVERPE